MSDLLLWLRSLFDHWQSWLSGGGLGGAVVIIVGIYERLRGKAMNKKVYVLIFIVFFILGASFMAWRDEHGLRIKAEKDNNDIRTAVQNKDKEITDLRNKLNAGPAGPKLSLMYEGKLLDGQRIFVSVDPQTQRATTGHFLLGTTVDLQQRR